MNILITGGAGYKGTLMAPELLNKGYKVTIFDNFIYGFEPVLGLVNHKNCTIIKGDIRNISSKDVKDYDVIYHLAGISGYPACEANPHSAQIINVHSTQKLVNLLSKDQILIYASTTSFYGKSGLERDEKSVPDPVSLYGITKYEAEKICMQHSNSVALRFATIFGTSFKMRCDLLLNDFVFRAINDRTLVLFDSKSKRTFLHVKDAIRSYLMVIEQYDKFKNNIFNVGSNDMNYSKLDLANKIKKFINFKIIETELEDPDKRDFIINFDKISALGFKPTISIDEGIEELIKLYRFYKPYSNFANI